MAPPVPMAISIPAIRNKAQGVQNKWLYPQLHPEARKNHGSSWGVSLPVALFIKETQHLPKAWWQQGAHVCLTCSLPVTLDFHCIYLTSPHHFASMPT